MPSFQTTISPSRRAAARFVVFVRRAIQQALIEEYRARGLTQAQIARELGVHRSVINREIRGEGNLTLTRIGELAYFLRRKPEFALPRRTERNGANIRADIDREAERIERPTPTSARVNSIKLNVLQIQAAA